MAISDVNLHTLPDPQDLHLTTGSLPKPGEDDSDRDLGPTFVRRVRGSIVNLLEKSPVIYASVAINPDLPSVRRIA
jgi:hypothetical protein